MICNLFSEPAYIFFSSDIPGLLYYSHIPTTIIALLVGLFVFINGKKLLLNQLLFVISISFSLWTLSNLVLWTNIHSDILLLVWSFLRIFSSIISIASIYFVYVYLEKRDLPQWMKWVFLVLLAPVIFFAPTTLNLDGFDITNCDAFMYEGVAYQFFKIAFGVLAMLWIAVLLVHKYRAAPEMRKQIMFLGVGVEAFLFTFFTINFLAGYLTDIGVLPDSSIEFYGLFGMTFFMGMLAYLIVRFSAFNIKLLGAQALIVSLVILVGSQYFFVETTTASSLTSITLALALGFGYFLVRSVKKEVEQRVQIAQLAETLEKANDRLKVLDKMKSEFVSIASHQLRSPLTSIRGYASMLSEGSYGKLTTKAQEVVDRIGDSAKYMALSVEDYLNVSRIEAGNMKYEISEFNLKEVAEKLVDEMRPVALKKGLVMVFRSDCDGSCSVKADIGKTRQIIMNLIDNAMKYTPKGTITVVAHDDPKKKKMYVTIQDTGVGMSKETQEEVFEKFVRAKNANNVNVTGTGLGLFVAKKMITDMKGRVWAESEGEGKGSTFHIELPLIPGGPTAR